KAFRILGYMERSTGLAAAGTWASGPTKIQLLGSGSKKPGDVVQTAYFSTTTSTATTSAIYVATALSTSITPTSETNLVKVVASSNGLSNVASNVFFVTLTRNGTGIGPEISGYAQSIIAYMPTSLSAIDAPGTTSSVTYAAYLKSQANGNQVYFPFTYN